MEKKMEKIVVRGQDIEKIKFRRDCLELTIEGVKYTMSDSIICDMAKEFYFEVYFGFATEWTKVDNSINEAILKSTIKR